MKTTKTITNTINYFWVFNVIYYYVSIGPYKTSRNKSLVINKTNSYAWYLLAKAYALNDNLALAQYASAERYYLRKDKPLALNFAKKAIKNIDKDTVEWYRANDLIQLIIGIDEKDNKNKTNINE